MPRVTKRKVHTTATASIAPIAAGPHLPTALAALFAHVVRPIPFCLTSPRTRTSSEPLPLVRHVPAFQRLAFVLLLLPTILALLATAVPAVRPLPRAPPAPHHALIVQVAAQRRQRTIRPA